MSKQEVIGRLRAGWRLSGNYDKLADFALVNPRYSGAATAQELVSSSIIRQLVRDGVLRRPQVGIGKAFMDSVRPSSLS